MPSAPLGSGVSLYGAVVLADYPEGYWRLHSTGTLDDATGNADNVLVAVGTPSDIAGLIASDTDRARDFNGTTGAYEVDDPTAIAIADLFSLEMWIKPDSVTSTHTLMSKGTNGFQLRTNGTALELRKEVAGSIVTSTGVTLAIGQTYHVVATKDGSDVHLYVNGADVTGVVTNLTIVATGDPLRIAGRTGGSEWYDGVLDEPAVYPYALTADQVALHYAAGASGTFGATIGPPSLPTVCVEIAFDTDWAAETPPWTDVSDFIRTGPGVKIALSGRADEHSETQPGTAQAVLNDRDRRFDSTNDSGPYGTDVGPMRPIRIRAAWDGFHYWLFRGWVESFATDWPFAGKDAISTIQCSDVFARLAGAEFPLGTSLDEQLPGARIADVLELAGVPVTLQNIDTGISTMPAVEEASGSMLAHLQAVAASDGGFLYVMQDGRICYETRTYRYTSEAVSRATFGDGGSGAPTEIPYVDIDPSKDTDYMFNHALIQSGDDTGTGESEDATSIARHGRKTFSRSVLTGYNDAQAATEWYVGRYKDPAVRFLGVTLNGLIDHDDLLPTLLAAYNSNRFTFKTRPIGGGTMELDEFIERIEHNMGTAGWIVNWSLSPFGDETPWQLGVSANDTLGTDSTPTW